MAETRDYYFMATYPDGSKIGPTRLLGVHTEKQAKSEIKRLQKAYPDCKIELD